MSYYRALGLVREPFSSSPDPDMLYKARPHLECLQQMEIAVRLRRGLNVVLGEVGTGKTTLARELARLLDRDGDMRVLVMDDPYYPSPAEFLMALARLLERDVSGVGRDTGLLREAVRDALLAAAGGGERIVTLIVDEGQKLTRRSLEILRELLNFEADGQKLLQIVIFAQTEFEATLAAMRNLEDRINFRCVLHPLTREQTRRMIETRLALCRPDGDAPPLFTRFALGRVHRLGKGYPRRIMRLCHHAMLLAVGYGKTRVGWLMVGRAARQERRPARPVPRSGIAWSVPAAVAGTMCALAGVLALGLTVPDPAGSARDMLSRGRALCFGQAPVAPVAAVRGYETRMPVTPPDASATSPEAAPPAGSGSLALAAAAVPATARETAPGPDLSSPLAVARLSEEDMEQIIVVAAESSPSAHAPQTSRPVDGPRELGRAVMRPGWLVSRQAARLYGAGTPQVLAEISRANQGLDCDRVRAGDALVFPAIPCEAPPRDAFLVSLGQADSLEAAFELLDNRRGAGASPMLLGSYHPATGLRFDVVLPEVFSSRFAAEAARGGLSKKLAARASVLAGHREGAVYFTDTASWTSRRPADRPATTVAVRQVASRP